MNLSIKQGKNQIHSVRNTTQPMAKRLKLDVVGMNLSIKQGKNQIHFVRNTTQPMTKQLKLDLRNFKAF